MPGIWPARPGIWPARPGVWPARPGVRSAGRDRDRRGDQRGSHHAGQDRAPDALRAAGFVARLTDAGLDVADLGDVARAVFTPDEITSSARNLATVVRVAGMIADAVEQVLASGRLPVVLGGDCTITLGVMAGVLRHHPQAGLLYVDGDADLATPDTTSSGVLDAMGAAHLLGLADNELARLGPSWPMLPDERLVQFGYDETDAESNRADVERAHPGLIRFTGPQVRADPLGCAARALAALARPPTVSWSTLTSTRWIHVTCRWPTTRTTVSASRWPWRPRCCPSSTAFPGCTPPSSPR